MRHLELDSAPASVARARRFCVEACRSLGHEDCADTVELLVSELVTNSVVHATGAQVRVRLFLCGPRLRVEVSDDDVRVPVARSAEARAENGRGMAMIDLLAAASGCHATGQGKTTWFEVAPP